MSRQSVILEAFQHFLCDSSAHGDGKIAEGGELADLIDETRRVLPRR